MTSSAICNYYNTLPDENLGHLQVVRVEALHCRYAEELHRFADAHLGEKDGVEHTPKGLTFVDRWGSLRHASGVAGVLAGYARVLRKKGRNSNAIMKFAEHQVGFSSAVAAYHASNRHLLHEVPFGDLGLPGAEAQSTNVYGRNHPHGVCANVLLLSRCYNPRCL